MKAEDIINQIKERIQVLESLKISNESGIIDLLRDKHVINNYEEKLFKKADRVCNISHKIEVLSNVLNNIH